MGASFSSPAPDESLTAVKLQTRDGKVLANSREVAVQFGKQHNNVIRDIETIIEDEPEAKLNFELSSYSNDLSNGRSYKQYEMDRDGFTITEACRELG